MREKLSGKLTLFLPVIILFVFIAGCLQTSTQMLRGNTTVSADPTALVRNYKRKDFSQPEIYTVKRKYLVEEKDVLDIEVRGEPEMTSTLRVSEDGTIRLPLLEFVKVTGLTIQGVEDLLEKYLKKGEFMKDPRVAVKINVARMLENAEKNIIVSGQVVTPGPVILTGKYITVFEAVSIAGGFTNIAARNRITVIREGDGDGEKKIIKVNLKKLKKGDRSQDIILESGDLIIVPETYF